MPIIRRTVWILALVSLCMDLASEMLYPVMPVYLKTIGFSLLWIGLLEGIAELLVGLTKGYFGQQSDRTGQRLPFVRLGYLMSAFSKPLMALFPNISGVFAARTLDRLGKGMRTAARDALLSAEATPQTKSRVFNFHRGWDTVGATLGPAAALLYLHYYPGAYKILFYLAFIPGILSVLLLLLLKEKHSRPAPNGRKGFWEYLRYIRKAPKAYASLATGLLIFSLANSSDLFLLMKVKEITGSDQIMISAYILYNLIYAVSAYPLGIWADRIRPKNMLLAGLLLFIVVYLGFAWNEHPAGVYVLFCLYGLYAAATEGVAKAWITNLVPKTETATALGFVASGQSIMALCASLIAGGVWEELGSSYVFGMAAAIAGIAFLWIYRK